MKTEIIKMIGPTVFYLFFLIYLLSCLFGTTLERLHDKWSVSCLRFFMLPGKLKDRDFYVMCIRCCPCGGLLLATAVYLLMIVGIWRGLY